MFNTAVLYLTPVSPQSSRRSQGIGVSDSDDDEASDLIWVWSPARTTQHTWVCCCKQEFSISGLPATADREIHRQIFGRGLWSDCHPPSTHTHTHTQPHTLSRLLLLSTAVLIQYLVSFAFAAYVTITQDPKSSRSGLIIAAGPLRINLSLKCLKSARGFRCACQWLGVIFGAHTHTHTQQVALLLRPSQEGLIKCKGRGEKQHAVKADTSTWMLCANYPSVDFLAGIRCPPHLHSWTKKL